MSTTTTTTAAEPQALPSPPSDGITCLKYVPSTSSSSVASSSTLLACTSWDGTVRLYDTKAMTNVCSQSMDSGPLLSLAVNNDGNSLFTGGIDGSVRRFDIASNKVSIIGYHSPNIIQGPSSSSLSNSSSNQENQLACSCLSTLSSSSSASTSVLASAGWDSKFYLWDVRTNSNNTMKPMTHIQLPNKAYSMDVDPSTGTRLVIATAGRRNVFIDVRMEKITHDEENTTPTDFAEIVLDRESTLKYQTRTIRFFPNGAAIAAGSIEGRVAIEFLEELNIPPPNNMKKYAFKCHRVNDNVFPVNSIAFHKSYNTFATGGCDGTVVTWDGLHKKKLALVHTFNTSIASMCFNNDGTELAIAASYTFEEGERDHPRDEIYVRHILDSEIRPKSMKK